MIKPIKPEEINLNELFPDEIVDAFNECIKNNLRQRKSTFKQKEVLDLILQKLPNLTKNDIFKSGWLDVEDLYRNNGWKVVYESPTYNEDFEPYFTFRF